MKLGLRITNKCNMKCKHCMYSCDESGEVMSKEIINKSYDFFLYNKSYFQNIGVWGGEPFLDIETFDYLWQIFKKEAESFYVSSNGTWMYIDKTRNYVLNFLNEIKLITLEEPSGVKISNTYWHAKSRNNIQDKSVEAIRTLIDNPKLLYEMFDWKDVNPFEDSKNRYFPIYLEDSNVESKKSLYNPVGRALLNKDTCNKEKKCFCTLAINDKYLKEEFDEMFIEIQPNGDLQICCASDSCIVGSVFEDDLSIEKIKKRILEIRENLNLTEDSKMIDTCIKCKKLKNYFN